MRSCSTTSSNFSHNNGINYSIQFCNEYGLGICSYLVFKLKLKIEISSNPLGGEDDDSGRPYIRHLLAALSQLLHRHILLPGHHGGPIHPGALLGHLLAGNEQFHVQSHYILLDELTVSSGGPHPSHNPSSDHNSPQQIT